MENTGYYYFCNNGFRGEDSLLKILKISQSVPLLRHKLGIPSSKRLLYLLNIVAQIGPLENII